jgi:putative flippase GtrA
MSLHKIEQRLSTTLASLTHHIPRDQLGRYLLIGLWNTALGYSSYAFLTWFLGHYISLSYLPASVGSSLLNITVAFLGYKWFVFRTKGNYLKEWARCLMIYSGGILLGLLLLPPTVFLVTQITDHPKTSPYIAGAILLGLNVIFSFFCHKRFSFRA